MGCLWDNYEQDSDWGYYHQATDDETVFTIGKCRLRCSEDSNCGAFEWDIKYCSWWKKDICQRKLESTISDTDYLMCRKPGTKIDVQVVLHNHFIIIEPRNTSCMAIFL